MQRKALLILIGLLTYVTLGACAASQGSPEATRATEPFPPTPTPAATAPPSPFIPTVPSSADSFEDLAAIFDYDREASLDVDLDLGGVSVHDISYASPMGGRVTAYVVVPPGEGPFAGVVFMHGAGGSRSQFLPEAVLLARMGAVSVLIDGPSARPEPWRRVSDPTDPTVDRDMHIQTVLDLRRAVDLLVSRPDVDAGRVGFIGHSYGAILGGILAGVEHRIKAYVLMSGYPRFNDAIPPEIRREQYAQAMEPIDPVHYIGHAAPSALLFQYGYYDQSIPPDLAVGYVDEASEPKLARWYRAGHNLNTQAFLDRAGWLAAQIGLDVAPLETIGWGE